MCITVPMSMRRLVRGSDEVKCLYTVSVHFDLKQNHEQPKLTSGTKTTADPTFKIPQHLAIPSSYVNNTKLLLLTIQGISLDDFGPCPPEELILLLIIVWPCWALRRAGMARIDVRREARAAREAKAICQ